MPHRIEPCAETDLSARATRNDADLRLRIAVPMPTKNDDTTEYRWVDITAPRHVTPALLVPVLGELVDHPLHHRLETLAGMPLDPSRSLQESECRSGMCFVLRPQEHPHAPPVIDDPIAASARAAASYAPYPREKPGGRPGGIAYHSSTSSDAVLGAEGSLDSGESSADGFPSLDVTKGASTDHRQIHRSIVESWLRCGSAMALALAILSAAWLGDGAGWPMLAGCLVLLLLSRRWPHPSTPGTPSPKVWAAALGVGCMAPSGALLLPEASWSVRCILAGGSLLLVSIIGWVSHRLTTTMRASGLMLIGVAVAAEWGNLPLSATGAALMVSGLLCVLFSGWLAVATSRIPLPVVPDAGADLAGLPSLPDVGGGGAAAVTAAAHRAVDTVEGLVWAGCTTIIIGAITLTVLSPAPSGSAITTCLVVAIALGARSPLEVRLAGAAAQATAAISTLSLAVVGWAAGPSGAVATVLERLVGPGHSLPGAAEALGALTAAGVCGGCLAATGRTWSPTARRRLEHLGAVAIALTPVAAIAASGALEAVRYQ